MSSSLILSLILTFSKSGLFLFFFNRLLSSDISTSRNKVINLLKKTRFVFSSPENQLSYFVLDAIRCNVKIISSSSLKPTYFKEFFVFPKKFNMINIKKIIFAKKKNFKRKKYLQKLKMFNIKVINFIGNSYAS